MNKNQSRLNFATINPSDILFLSNHVQISRRKAVALTTSRERFLEAVYDSKLKASKKEAAKKSFEADKAEQEVLRQKVRAERDKKVTTCEETSCSKTVLMGHTRIIAGKFRAQRVCAACFKKMRGLSTVAKQEQERQKEEMEAAAWLAKELPVRENPVINMLRRTEKKAELVPLNIIRGFSIDDVALAKAEEETRHLKGAAKTKSMAKKVKEHKQRLMEAVA